MCDFLRFFIFHFCEVERKLSYNLTKQLERGKGREDGKAMKSERSENRNEV